jgi:hypothetical protein
LTGPGLKSKNFRKHSFDQEDKILKRKFIFPTFAIVSLLLGTVACNLNSNATRIPGETPAIITQANPILPIAPSPELPSGLLQEPTYRFYAPAVQSKASPAEAGRSASPGEGGPAATQESIVDPRVEILVSKTTLQVGESVTIVGQPIDIGLPNYSLDIRDEGVQDAPPLVKVTYDNQVESFEDSSNVLSFVSAEGQTNQGTFVLQAKAEGKATVTITAEGELPTQENGAAWTGAGSGSVVITVTK